MIISYYYTGVGLGGIVNIKNNKEDTVAMIHISHPDLFRANSSLHTPLLSTLYSFLQFTQSTSSLFVYMVVHIQKCICLHLYIQNDYLRTKRVPLTESKFTELHVDFLNVSLSLQHSFHTQMRAGDSSPSLTKGKTQEFFLSMKL